VHCAPAELSAFLSRVLVSCLEIRAVWSSADAGSLLAAASHQLIVFADKPTLLSLRRSGELHRADVELLVVFDGDRFENAWGPQRLSGSLSRWSWRQVSDELAYFDESKWSHAERDAGTVVRVRRQAVLIWAAASLNALQ
jgi:hypothetical protein